MCNIRRVGLLLLLAVLATTLAGCDSAWWLRIFGPQDTSVILTGTVATSLGSGTYVLNYDTDPASAGGIFAALAPRAELEPPFVLVTGTLDMEGTQYALGGSYNTESGTIGIASGIVDDGGGVTITHNAMIGSYLLDLGLAGFGLRPGGTFNGTVSGSTITVTGAQYEGGALFYPDGSREVLDIVTGTGTFVPSDPADWDFRLEVHVEASSWLGDEQIGGYTDDALVLGETVELAAPE